MPRPFESCWAAYRLSIIRTAISASIVLLMFISVGVLLAGAQTLPSDASSTCTIATSTFNGFFQSGTPTLNGVVNPANSVAFSNVPNCSFYQWAQQMFLWLTSPAPAEYGGGGGRIFASPTFYTVGPADPTNGNRKLIANSASGILNLQVRAAQVGVHGLPVIISKTGQMFEVQPPPLSNAGKPVVLNRAGKQVEVSRATLENGKLVLLDTTGKPIAGAKPVIQKQITPQILQRLKPQLEESNKPAPEPQAREQENLKTLAPVLAQLKNIKVVPVNPNLIAQKFVVNGIPIFLNVSGGVIDTEEGQADQGVLIAQNGSLIYYVSMVNDVYAYLATGTKDGGITPTPTQFPTTAAALTKITAFASAHGKTFPDPNALAVEVKSAWIEASSLSNPNDYITTEAIIPTYNTSNPAMWVPNGQKQTKLALVGMHVVGSANGHPEMIWATFEHFGNAPNAQFNYNSTGGPKNVPQNTTGTWLFAASGATAPFNCARQSEPFGTTNIVLNSPPPTGCPTETAIGPDNVIRFKPFGAALNASPNPVDVDTDGAASNTEIIAIDNSIASKMPAGDVRDNYYMTGATWTINGGAFNGNFGNPGNNTVATGTGVGTSQLANTTMETFQQNGTSWSKTANNCFTCHQGNTFPVSHMFCDPVFGCSAGIQPLF